MQFLIYLDTQIQYRMHPEIIRSFPSAEFYTESLEDGPHIEERTEFHGMTIVVSDPSVFFLLGKQESGNISLVNVVRLTLSCSYIIIW